MTDLHLKYRPKQLDQIVGNEGVVRTLKMWQKTEKFPHALLVTGPSGTGKTTVARIIGKLIGCRPQDIVESDAARFSGVDQARSLAELASYATLGGTGKRLFILDECHNLSKQSQNALLKTIEEPGEHAYFALLTTEGGRILRTVQTRCHPLVMHELPTAQIAKTLKEIVRLEEISLPSRHQDNILTNVAVAAQGSMRHALVYLTMVSGVKTRKQAATILQTPVSESDAVELARLLASGKKFPWTRVTAILENLKESNPETVRRIIMNYLTGCAMKEKRMENAMFFLEMMSAFEEPYGQSEGWAPLLLSIGRVLPE